MLLFIFHASPCHYFSSSLFIAFPLGQLLEIMSSAHWSVPSETRWSLSSEGAKHQAAWAQGESQLTHLLALL